MILQSRDSCTYASKKSVTKMLAQYESPVKQKVDIKVKLTPEEKLHFREAQESDPKFLLANRKLEESLQKCNGSKNGSKFRFTIPQNKSRSDIDSSVVNEVPSDKKVSENVAGVVNLNSSHDIFDEMVADTNLTSVARRDVSFEDQTTHESANDSSRLSITGIDASFEQRTTAKTLPDNTKKSSMTSISIKDSNITTKTNNKIDSVATSSIITNSLDSGINTKRFVFRTATATRAANNNAETKSQDSEQNQFSSPKSKRDDNDKYDVDTVLRELSHENRLPIGANRTRPNSPKKNTHEMPEKSFNRAHQKELEKNDNDSPDCSSSIRRSCTPSSSNMSSFTTTSSYSNSTVTNPGSITCNETRSRTGFENLQNVLDRISNSSAVKTTSNVSSTALVFLFHFIYKSIFPSTAESFHFGRPTKIQCPIDGILL